MGHIFQRKSYFAIAMSSFSNNKFSLINVRDTIGSLSNEDDAKQKMNCVNLFGTPMALKAYFS